MIKQQNQNLAYKILVILASALLLVLFLVGIIQTFVHKNALATNKKLEEQNQLVQSEIDQRTKDENFINNPDGEEIVKH